MAEMMKYEIVSPDRLLKSAEAVHVVLPGVEGDFGVLANHAPMMSTMRPGVVSIFAAEGGEAERFFVKGGLAQVAPEGLSILAEEAIDLDSVDASALEAEIANVKEDIEDVADAQERSRLEAELIWRQRLAEIIAA